MLFFTIIFVLICLAIVLLLIGCYLLTFYSPYKGAGDHRQIPPGSQYQKNKDMMLRLIDDLLNIPCEEVDILSVEGLRLHGRYYHRQDNAPIDVCFHGYRGTYARDFCGGAHISMQLGHNVLLVDQRAHGKSQGHSICFGIREQYDCLQWINYLIQRFGENIHINLIGVSMGASTVLMAAGLPLPEQVKHIIADCPYSSVPDIIKRVCTKRNYPLILYPFIACSARIFAGISLKSASCITAVKKADKPILLIHGEDDRVVPCEMSHEISRANPSLIQLQTFPGAGHGLSFLADKDRYESLVKSFLSST